MLASKQHRGEGKATPGRSVVGGPVAGVSETRAAWATALVDAAPDAIVIVDGEGRLAFVNAQAERLFGYARSELVGEPVEILVTARFQKLQGADGPTNVRPPEWTLDPGSEPHGLRKDGSEFPVEIGLGPFETVEGWFVMASVRDATERQEQLHREQAARAKAERLARMNEQLCSEAEKARAEAEAASRAKDDFLLTLSHELRTPLTPIFLWTGMLRQPDLPRAVVGRALDGIERGARSQTRLIEDMLDVSRIITGKLHVEQHPVTLDGPVGAALEAVRSAAAAKTVVLDAEVAENALVLGDAQRLEQVATNLLTNAIKFSHAGSRVTIRVECRGDEVQLTVQDTGHGIAPAFLQRVFAPFEQADASTTRSHGGLGLGLTIVRHLVERHGGSVRAESGGLGKGATFTVILPTWRVPAPHPSGGGECTGQTIDLDGLRVLVVDDDPDTGGALETLLAAHGAEARSVVSVSQALTLLAQWAAELIISDIAMPGQDGYALIQQLRAMGGSDERMSHVPAIALTACARTDDRRDALAAGFDEYVVKPVPSSELFATIARLVDARTQ